MTRNGNRGNRGLNIGLGTIILIIIAAVVLRFALNVIVDIAFVLIVGAAIVALILFVWNFIRGRRK